IFFSLLTILLFLPFDLTAKGKKKTKENVDANDTVVISDWTDKALGSSENPAWLFQLQWGNDYPFKNQWGLSNDTVCRLSRGVGPSQNAARIRSRTDGAASIVRELRQTIISKTGSGFSDDQLKAVLDSAISAKVDISGLREETSFWRKLTRRNGVTREITSEYEYFTVYSMNKDTWDNLCKAYLLSVMNSSNLNKETQAALGAIFTSLKDTAHRESDIAMKEEHEVYKSQLSRLPEENTAMEELESLLK
nr:hypothetical protein [Treponema sp.]